MHSPELGFLGNCILNVKPSLSYDTDRRIFLSFHFWLGWSTAVPWSFLSLSKCFLCWKEGMVLFLFKELDGKYPFSCNFSKGHKWYFGLLAMLMFWVSEWHCLARLKVKWLLQKWSSSTVNWLWAGVTFDCNLLTVLTKVLGMDHPNRDVQSSQFVKRAGKLSPFSWN